MESSPGKRTINTASIHAASISAVGLTAVDINKAADMVRNDAEILANIDTIIKSIDIASSNSSSSSKSSSSIKSIRDLAVLDLVDLVDFVDLLEWEDGITDPFPMVKDRVSLST